MLEGSGVDGWECQSDIQGKARGLGEAVMGSCLWGRSIYSLRHRDSAREPEG